MSPYTLPTQSRAMQELIAAEIRPSKQRVQVLNYFNSCSGKLHPTIEETFCALREGRHSLSMATVYNTVNLFVDHGLLIPIENPGETTRYDRNLDEHAHFFCRRCKTLHDLPVEVSAILPKTDYQVETFQVLFQGVCPACLAKQTQGEAV